MQISSDKSLSNIVVVSECVVARKTGAFASLATRPTASAARSLGRASESRTCSPVLRAGDAKRSLGPG